MRSQTHWSLMNLLIYGRTDHYEHTICFSFNAMWLYIYALLKVFFGYVVTPLSQRVDVYFMYAILRLDTFNIHVLCY